MAVAQEIAGGIARVAVKVGGDYQVDNFIFLCQQWESLCVCLWVYKGEWDKKKFLFKRKISSGMGKDWRVHQEKGRIQKLLW